MSVALLVIDMQNDFVLPGAILCVDGAMATVPKIKKLLNFARENQWNIIHVVREHDRFGINADRPRQHLFQNGGNGYCVAGTDGAHIIEDLIPKKDEIILKKTRNSAFFATNLDSILRRLDVKTVVISGTQYPNCIRATANDAMSFDYEVIVVTDCCSAKTKDIAQANIVDLQNMGIQCIELKELMELCQ